MSDRDRPSVGQETTDMLELTGNVTLWFADREKPYLLSAKDALTLAGDLISAVHLVMGVDR